MIAIEGDHVTGNMAHRDGAYAVLGLCLQTHADADFRRCP